MSVDLISLDLGGRHLSRLLCSTATTLWIGRAFCDLTLTQGLILGSCCSIAWSITNLVLKHFNCDIATIRTTSHLGSVFLGIPIAGFAFLFSSEPAIALSLSLVPLSLMGSLLGNGAYFLITTAVIAVSMFVNQQRG